MIEPQPLTTTVSLVYVSLGLGAHAAVTFSLNSTFVLYIRNSGLVCIKFSVYLMTQQRHVMVVFIPSYIGVLVQRMYYGSVGVDPPKINQQFM